MNKNEVKKLREKVLLSLESRFHEYGFTLKVKPATFENSEAFIHWGPTRTFPDALIFRPWIRIENKEIKKILKTLFPSEFAFNTIVRTQGSSFAHEMNVWDMDNSPFNFQDENGSSYYYRIEHDTDLDVICEDHFRFMSLVGFPFIDKLNSLDGVNAYINNRVLAKEIGSFQREEDLLQVRKFFDKREVLSGAIAAHLLEKDNLEELLRRYRILFEGNSYILTDLDKVIQHFSN